MIYEHGSSEIFGKKIYNRNNKFFTRFIQIKFGEYVHTHLKGQPNIQTKGAKNQPAPTPGNTRLPVESLILSLTHQKVFVANAGYVF